GDDRDTDARIRSRADCSDGHGCSLQITDAATITRLRSRSRLRLRARLRALLPGRWLRLHRQRQGDRELGEAPLLAVDANAGAVQLDDALGDVEAEPGRIGRLRGVVARLDDLAEGLENLLTRPSRDPDAVVTHAQRDVAGIGLPGLQAHLAA